MAYLSCAKDNGYPLLLIFNLIPPCPLKRASNQYFGSFSKFILLLFILLYHIISKSGIVKSARIQLFYQASLAAFMF